MGTPSALKPNLSKWMMSLSILLLFLGATSRVGVIGISTYLNHSAENLALIGALDVSESKDLFPGTGTIPFRVYTYTPLHPWIVGGLLTPLKHLPTLDRVYLIRLLSFFFLILSLTLFWRFYFKELRISNLFFLLSLALGFSEFSNYALSGRNDTLAILFEIIAGVFFIRWLKKDNLLSLLCFSTICVLALLTRQNSAAMLISGLLYLLLHHRFRELVFTLLSFSLFLGGALLSIDHSFPFFWAHSFKTHVGVWRPFYWFHPNTLLFLSTYSLFLYLGIRNLFRKDNQPTVHFLKLVVLVSAAISFVLIHRHGAWLNYFLETILILCFFTSRELAQLNDTNRDGAARKTIKYLIPGFALFIFFANFARATKLYVELAGLDFPDAAIKVRLLAPNGGVSLGAWAQGLGVYLRDWELVGPEILNGGHYGEANFKNFSWIYEKLGEKMNSAHPPALLYVNPQCGGAPTAAPLISDPYLKPLMAQYRLHAQISPWLCLYTRP